MDHVGSLPVEKAYGIRINGVDMLDEGVKVILARISWDDYWYGVCLMIYYLFAINLDENTSS